MTGHHLVLGELTDAITGELLEDSHDERYRQEIARILMADKGFSKDEISPRIPLTVAAGKRRGRIRVEFMVRVGEKTGMMIKYGPGSLVTRHLAGPGHVETPCRPSDSRGGRHQRRGCGRAGRGLGTPVGQGLRRRPLPDGPS